MFFRIASVADHPGLLGGRVWISIGLSAVLLPAAAALGIAILTKN